MANEIPNMSLKQATFNQGSFTPVVYTPQSADMSILANSLAKIEERQEKAYEKKNAIDLTLGKVEEQLHNDKDTKAWFNQYKDNIEAKINNNIYSGDYGNAIRVATDLAGKVAKDSELQARVKSNADYQAVVNKVKENKNLRPETIERWQAQNPYAFNPITENGKVIGTQDWRGSNDNPFYATGGVPVDDIDWAEVSEEIAKMVAPDKSSNTKSSSSTRASDHSSYKDGTGGGTSSETSSSSRTTNAVTKLDYAMLERAKHNLFGFSDDPSTGGKYRDAAAQDYYNQVYKIQKLTQQRDLALANNDAGQAALLDDELDKYKANSVLYDGDQLVSLDEYISNNIDNLLRRQSYTWTETVRETGSVKKSGSTHQETTRTDPSSGGGNGNGGSTGGGGLSVVVQPSATSGPNVLLTPWQTPTYNSGEVMQFVIKNANGTNP